VERKTFIQTIHSIEAIKIWNSCELCESSVGYLWSFIIFTGRETEFQSTLISEEKSKTAAIVLSLVEPLLHKGYALWMDNIKMFRRLLSATILNSMVICRANSQGKGIDRLKFRVDMVQALLVQHGAGVERKVPGRHSTDNTVPRLLERHFSERIPSTERKSMPTKRCVVLQKKKKTRGRRQCFGVLIVRPVCVLRAASRPTTPSSAIKVKIYIIYINFSV
jgi:hypothetical protein